MSMQEFFHIIISRKALKYRLFGMKEKNRPISPNNNTIPRGIVGTIVPKEFQGEDAPQWDDKLFKNKIYI